MINFWHGLFVLNDFLLGVVLCSGLLVLTLPCSVRSAGKPVSSVNPTPVIIIALF